MITDSCKKDLLHWANVKQIKSNSNNNLFQIKFIDVKHGFICGGDVWSFTAVLNTSDGGITWDSVPKAQSGKAMLGMSVSYAGGIYMCGVDGDIIFSKDTGRTWNIKRIGDWNHYVSGVFTSPDTGIFLCTTLQRQSCITKVDSNFNIINQQTFPFGLNNLYMVSQSTGYAIGYGAVLKTTDFGINWNYLNVQDDNFTSMDIHGDEIWMCGYNGGVYHTIDGGEHWAKQRNGNDFTLPHYGFWSILFTDAQNGWITCDNGSIMYSNDGGSHWMEFNRFASTAQRSIAVCPAGGLITVGDNGSIYRIFP